MQDMASLSDLQHSVSTPKLLEWVSGLNIIKQRQKDRIVEDALSRYFWRSTPGSEPTTWVCCWSH